MNLQNKIIEAIEVGVQKALNEKHGIYNEIDVIYNKFMNAYENKDFVDIEKDKKVEYIKT